MLFLSMSGATGLMINTTSERLKGLSLQSNNQLNDDDTYTKGPHTHTHTHTHTGHSNKHVVCICECVCV